MNPNRLPSTVAFILLAVILGKTTAQLCYCVNYDDIIYYYNDGINNAGDNHSVFIPYNGNSE